MQNNDKISIGKILNFHGIKGEAKVGFSKGKNSQIAALKEVFVSDKKLNIENVRFHKNFAIIKFREINSINELLEFKGENIYIPKNDIINNLKQDEYLVEDLIGLNVFDEKDDLIGQISDIGNNGETDILKIKTPEGSKEILIPFVKEIVPIIDYDKNKVIIKTIEGLIEDVQ